MATTLVLYPMFIWSYLYRSLSILTISILFSLHVKNEYTDACFHDDQELSELDLSYDYIKSGPGYIQRITDSR